MVVPHLPPPQASLPLLGACLHLAVGLGAPRPLQCCGGGDGGGELCRAGAVAPRGLLG